MSYISDNSTKLISEAFEKRLKPLGVTRVQWIALYYIGEFERVNQKDLAKLMNIKESTLARLMDRMEKEDLIERLKDPKDKRITNIILTKLGQAKRKEIMPQGELFNEDVSKDISDQEMEIFLRVLSKMVSNIEV